MHKKIVKAYVDKKRSIVRSTGNQIYSEDHTNDPEIEKTYALLKKDTNPIDYGNEEVSILSSSIEKPQIKLAKNSLHYRKIEREE